MTIVTSLSTEAGLDPRANDSSFLPAKITWETPAPGFASGQAAGECSLLSNLSLLAGNSGSGIIESTSVRIPALNIGIRQRGREHAANVLDVPADRQAIAKAIRKAESPAFRQSIKRLVNPYGDGRACPAMVKVLTETPLDSRLLFKA